MAFESRSKPDWMKSPGFGNEVNRGHERGLLRSRGHAGYVMVTDLLLSLGVQRKSEPDEKSLALLTDVDATRPSTGLERELAELLASGSPTRLELRCRK